MWVEDPDTEKDPRHEHSPSPRLHHPVPVPVPRVTRCEHSNGWDPTSRLPHLTSHVVTTIATATAG